MAPMKVFTLWVTICVVAAVSGCGGDATQPAPAPTATADAPTPTVSPPTVLQIGDDVALPTNLALFVETGCWQCSGGPEALYRVETDATTRLAESLPGQYFGVLGTVDGRTLWVLMAPADYEPCLDCTPSELTAFASTDGGDTFEERGRVNGRARAAVAVNDELILSMTHDEPSLYVRLDGSAVEPPPGPGEFHPLAVSNSQIGWITNDGNTLVRTDGTVIVSMSSDRVIERVAPYGDDRDSLIVFSVSRRGGEGRVAIVRSHQLVADLALEQGFLVTLQSVTSADGTPVVVGNLFLDRPLSILPSLVEMPSGTLHQLRSTFDAAPLTGERNFVIGARTFP